jgi:LPXTG-site transpeptidase (sortase) family protein
MNPNHPLTGPGLINPSAPEQPADPVEDTKNLAADVIRRKIAALYGDAPDVEEEIVQAKQLEATPVGSGQSLTKHQQFMQSLTTSGKTSEEVQAAWHEYYQALPDGEKHQVWQEFYSFHAKQRQQPGVQVAPGGPAAPHAITPGTPPNTDKPAALPEPAEPPEEVIAAAQAEAAQPLLKPELPPPPPALARSRKPDGRTVSDIKQQILGRVNQRGKLQAKHHFQSLLFGVGMGSIALMLLLMGFFNERFIAPFITPSKAVSNTPIIVDANSAVASGEPKVIIPKINVEIPVVYDEPSIAEHAIQNALERGVVHYATTPAPGEQGNAVVFGHSSNNILNKGKYKFAFVLLNRLEDGDTFMLTRDGKRYVYRIYAKKVVKPTEVGVLGAAARPNSATLITCDPPGTAINRLVVTGEQISPDPIANVASKTAPVAAATAPVVIPSNAPSLWQRLTGWL